MVLLWRQAEEPFIASTFISKSACACVFVFQYHHQSLIQNETNKYDKHDRSEEPLCLENKDLTVIPLPFCLSFVHYVMMKSEGTQVQ